jgi:16S rRNA (cytidine1402-2'-O)-methyltransferase
VLFEAPHRLAASLADMADVLGGERRAVVCRELTKTHEEVRRGTLADLAAWAADGVRGEVTVVLAGAAEAPELAADDLPAAVAVREQAGLSRKDAIAAVASESGRPRREVYDAVVAAKQQPVGGPPAH